MNLPKQTAEIYTTLRKGLFICSISRQHRKLYELLNDDCTFEILRDYFLPIQYRLERGNGYFYFAKGLEEGETSTDLEEKIKRFNRYVDVLAFFGSLEEKLSVGVKFRPSKIAEECISNPLLKAKLDSIKSLSTIELIGEKVRELAKELKEEGFVEKTDPTEENYLVLDSFHYMEQIVFMIEPGVYGS